MKYCMQHNGKNGNEAREVYLRGRCRSCYNSIMRRIRTGALTEARAVKEGWLKEAKR